MSYDDNEECPTADRLRQLLVGKTVVSATTADEKEYEWSDTVTHGVLTLSDGTVLKVWGNTGCGGCSAGWYTLETLGAPDGIITNVEVDEHPDGDRCAECDAAWECEHQGFYRIFVVAEDKRLTLASFEGSDGNGYYGTGWWLRVETDA